MSDEEHSASTFSRGRIESAWRGRGVGWSAGLFALASLASLAMAGCSGGSGPGFGELVEGGNGGSGSGGSGGSIPLGPIDADTAFFSANTVSQRVGLPLSGQGALLRAEALAHQLAGYDPGSLLRCQLAEQDSYDAVIDALGGVPWGYGISVLEDQSKPRFLAGFQDYDRNLYPSAAAGDAAGAPVEIALPDIVAVTDDVALFYSVVHGLLLVDLSAGEPRFACAMPLPGRADQFHFRDGHLVAMVQSHGVRSSALLHFAVEGAELRFVESVELGRVNILDSRRFNDKLVFYTDLQLGAVPSSPPVPSGGGLPQADAVEAFEPAGPRHRTLRVFRLGDTLVEEMSDTLLDTTAPPEQLAYQDVTPETPVDTLINESHRFGQGIWASDRYFVVTDAISRTYLAGWRSRSYSVCTQSHTVETPYTDCRTEYETRPNPNYVPPDNSGGDRGCQGQTLSDCLRAVARASNPTLQVPVGRRCEPRVRYDWVCDAREQRTVEYPDFRQETATHLFIYEYTDAGFVRLDSSVHEITTPGLDTQSLDSEVATLTSSTEAFELSVPGEIQTLQFQNGYLYVISQGVLQVYALGENSIVRTSTLPVVNDSLQSTLFSGDRLYLSDFGWSGGDHSTLKVVNLENAAFPTVEASTHSLPGGHRSILASAHGIFTIGSVRSFEGQAIDAIKLALFSDPYVAESAYLILGTDLKATRLAPPEAEWFGGLEERALVPYWGQDELEHSIVRVGVSHVEAGAIVSEGAVVVPELPERLRALPGQSESYLTFANNSIEWLTPSAPEWQATPVLEYFVPIAVYRLNDADDYAEVQRLGNRCRLYFANAAHINQRAAGNYSEFFDCFGYGVTAYGNILLFSDTGVQFDAGAASIRILDEAELTDTRARIAERPYCLLSEQLVMDTRVDYGDMPERQHIRCMSPAEYETRRNELIERAPTP